MSATISVSTSPKCKFFTPILPLKQSGFSHFTTFSNALTWWKPNTYSKYTEIGLSADQPQKSEDASNVVSFYDFWGLMVKKHYLPKWTFQDSSLYTLRQAWENVKPYVEYRRITQPVYASHFEWLIEKIKEKPTRKN